MRARAAGPAPSPPGRWGAEPATRPPKLMAREAQVHRTPGRQIPPPPPRGDAGQEARDAAFREHARSGSAGSRAALAAKGAGRRGAHERRVGAEPAPAGSSAATKKGRRPPSPCRLPPLSKCARSSYPARGSPLGPGRPPARPAGLSAERSAGPACFLPGGGPELPGRRGGAGGERARAPRAAPVPRGPAPGARRVP